MKKLLAVLVVVVLLCACTSRGRVEEITKESESTFPAIEEAAPDTLPDTEEELDIDIGNPLEDVEEIPEGYTKVDFGEFAVLICDTSFSGCAPEEAVTKENNQFVGDNGEQKRVIAEVVSIEEVIDSDAPFAPCDEEYLSAVNIVDLVFNGFSAKKYHIQTQSDGPVPMKVNTIYYCIELDGKIVTFAYYPVMGMGGLHTEDIEIILDTIQ